jgi:PhoPQ-activated pathogenicity-related protein
MVDPFTYRDRLTMPKLIVCGTNDAYWTVDALNLYRDQLQGEVEQLYVPNSGHGLGDFMRPLTSMAAFATQIADGTPRPDFKWRYEGEAGHPQLRVTAPAATKVVLWTATAKAGKFVDGKWVDQVMTRDGDDWVAKADVPTDGQQLALFGEATFAAGDINYTLSTSMKLLP